VLHSGDFAAWDNLVASTLGHHRSRLLPGSGPFAARMQAGAVAEFQMLWIQGRGLVELRREQCGHGVLWLPLQGLTHEVINGVEHLAEPGMALLFRPGDAMQGCTSEEMAGISILIPAHHLRGVGAPSPLIDRGPLQRRLIDAAHLLSDAAAHQPRGAIHSAAVLEEALRQWCNPEPTGQTGPWISMRRRRDTVARACQWIDSHHAARFSVTELSQAIGVSVRTLQYAFQTELGCSPMAEAKRLRLRRLRHLLQDPERDHQSIATLMEAAGLLAGGATAADYRRWSGETPRQTRQRR
jgi:AraC-like DNA-binding protein